MTWDVHIGDCLDQTAGMASLPDRSVDLVVTDPPYDQHTHESVRSSRRAKGDRRAPSRREVDLRFSAVTPRQMHVVSDEFARLARRWVLVFSAFEMVSVWRRALGRAGLDPVRVGVWVKLGSAPQFTGDRPAAGAEAIVIAHAKSARRRPMAKRWNGGGMPAVWTCPVVNHGRTHVTEKPLALMERLVELFSDQGDLVLDPFVGSGTTGVAARRLGRRFVGWEVDEKHAAAARVRIGDAREQLAIVGAAAQPVEQLTLGGVE